MQVLTQANPIYKGYYIYGKSRFKGQRGHTSPGSWVYSEIQNPELVIIEESYWNKANVSEKHARQIITKRRICHMVIFPSVQTESPVQDIITITSRRI